jgi:hypothetical protein
LRIRLNPLDSVFGVAHPATKKNAPPHEKQIAKAKPKKAEPKSKKIAFAHSRGIKKSKK